MKREKSKKNLNQKDKFNFKCLSFWIKCLEKKIKRRKNFILFYVVYQQQAPADYHKNNKLFKLWNKKPLQSTQLCLFHFIIQKKNIKIERICFYTSQFSMLPHCLFIKYSDHIQMTAWTVFNTQKTGWAQIFSFMKKYENEKINFRTERCFFGRITLLFFLYGND